MMARLPRWKNTLRSAREEAALAVRLYNDSSQTRSFEGFVVHMHLAWLYLLHAKFEIEGVDYRYRNRTNPRRLERIDGEVKRWELAKCVKQRWEPEEAVRKNLEFFIGLRNRIEHRHSDFDEALSLTVAGKAQSLLLNFEFEMTTTFGEEWTMASILRVPLFIGTFTEDGVKTLLALRGKLPADLSRFISEFHSGISRDVEDDPRFEIQLNVVLTKVNRDPNALAIQFVDFEDMTDEEKAATEVLGRQGRLITRERQRSVVNRGLLRSTAVVERVSEAIPFKFTTNDLVKAYRKQSIRPTNGADRPERTDEKYCFYDTVHNSYLYTKAWVERLIKDCATSEGFEDMVGLAARPKEGAALSEATLVPSLKLEDGDAERTGAEGLS